MTSMANQSWDAYLEAADGQSASVGSDSSTALPASDSSLKADRERSALARTPLSRHAEPWTPLSSKAEPFVSSLGSASSFRRWMPFLLVGKAAPTNYSEEAQEDVYVSQEGPDLQPYSETLQEDVYLSKVDEVKFPPPRGRLMISDTRLPSRTPSPSGAVDTIASVASVAAKFLSVAAGGSFFSNDLEGIQQTESDHAEGNSFCGSAKSIPVKRTFIHYDTSDTDSEAPFLDDSEFKRLSKSASAPSIMVSDVFHKKMELDVPLPDIIKAAKSDPALGDEVSMQASGIEAMYGVHSRGECSPCAYFYQKTDGCRWGYNCKFCHMCPSDEIKRRRKEKNRVRKQERDRSLKY